MSDNNAHLLLKKDLGPFAAPACIAVERSSRLTKHRSGRNVFGAIEGGGTKFVCAVGTGPDDLVMTQFSTESPEPTIARAVAFLKERAGVQLQAVGIGSFGPVDLSPSSPTFGCITSTPKTGLPNYDF